MRSGEQPRPTRRLGSRVVALAPIAAEVGASLAQRAFAWATRHPRVPSVILGASRSAQIQGKPRAMALREKLTPEVCASIDAICLPLAH